MPSFSDMMMARMAGEYETEHPKLAPDIEAIRLRGSLDALNVRHEFRPGMIVRQKPQARAYRMYGDNDRAIVIEMLETPLIGSKEGPGSQHYRTPMNMIIGAIQHLNEEKHFCLYHVDSRRFEPVPEGG